MKVDIEKCTKALLRVLKLKKNNHETSLDVAGWDGNDSGIVAVDLERRARIAEEKLRIAFDFITDVSRTSGFVAEVARRRLDQIGKVGK